MIKKIVYNLIKYPLILIFLKTPLIKILEKNFKYHRSIKSENKIITLLNSIFQKEYFAKINTPKKLRELASTTVADGEGSLWAKYYYGKHFKTLNELKVRKVGLLTLDESTKIYSKIINYIKTNNLDNNQDLYIIQLGSCSGRDLEFFRNQFPSLNYISTDVNDEILNFQKTKYSYNNFSYYKCFAEDINKCIEYYNLKNKSIIVFSVSSLQYVVPFYLKEFFDIINNYADINVFISEPVSLNFIEANNECSRYRGNTSFSHNYKIFSKKLNILEYDVIEPYSKDDKFKGDTGHYYLHAKSIRNRQ